MLNFIKNVINPPGYPSALLVLGNFGATICVFHLVPEDGTVERFNLTTSPSYTTFRCSGAREQARRQIGTIKILARDIESVSGFFDGVKTRALKLRSRSASSGPAQAQKSSIETTHLVQNILQPAAMEEICERELRDRSTNATQESPVFIVYIKRSRAGKILTEPTSVL